MSKQIKLTQGKFAIVDESDFAVLSKHKWLASRGCNAWYANRTTRGGGTQGTESMHRRILGAQSNQQVDHVNGNGLDNRRVNLRLCTNRQNAQNRRGVRGKCSFKGVRPDGNRWRSRIRSGDGVETHLGMFSTAEGAARAYDRAAVEQFGAFAATNVKLGLLA